MIRRSLTLTLLMLLAFAWPAVAQDEEAEQQSTDPQTTSVNALYVEFRQAVCRQEWQAAITLMDDLLDEELGDLRQQYVAYRQQLVQYRRDGMEFEEMPGCDGEEFVSVEG